MRVLFVCTANICRSPSAERLLRKAVAAHPQLSGTEGDSAGTEAIPGMSGCRIAPALESDSTHVSARLDLETIAAADLILAAERAHVGVILRLDPAARSRTFTLRHAGRIAAWLVDSGMVAAGRERSVVDAAGAGVGEAAPRDGDAEAPGNEDPVTEDVPVAWADRFEPGDPRASVEPLPSDARERWDWVVTELDAGRSAVAAPVVAGERGRAGREAADAGPSRRWPWQRRDEPVVPDSISPDDIVDPHVHGSSLHAIAYEEIAESVAALVRLLLEVQA